MKESQEIKFMIKGILVTKFSLDLRDELIKLQAQKPEFNEYTFEINIANQGNIKENILISNVNMKVFLDKEKRIELGSICISNIFEINNLKNFFEEEKYILKLPNSFEASIIGISLSHTRAIFVTKCAGTFLQNAVLPILNPSDFLKLNSEKKVKEIS